MSRKDYKALAAALYNTSPSQNLTGYDEAQIEQWRSDVRAVAGVLAADNPRFNQERFFTAAGMDKLPEDGEDQESDDSYNADMAAWNPDSGEAE